MGNWPIYAAMGAIAVALVISIGYCVWCVKFTLLHQRTAEAQKARADRLSDALHQSMIREADLAVKFDDLKARALVHGPKGHLVRASSVK